MASELVRRTAFAVVAAPLAVLLVIAGGLPFAILLGVIAGIGAWELFRIARAGGLNPLAAGVVLAAALPVAAHARRLALTAGGAVDTGRDPLAGVAAALGAPLVQPGIGVALVFVVLLVLLAATIWTRGVQGRPLGSASVTVAGILYTGGTLSFAYLIRYHPYAVGRAAGAALVAMPMILTWASDTGGYAVGRLLGRRKLIPSVSPGKTVEGSLGALAVTAVTAWAYAEWVLRPYGQLALTTAGAVAFGLAVSAAAQVGDLFESLVKREAGVKDSSQLIPGHGGVLDRFDSIFFVMPVAFLLLDLLLIAAPTR